MPKEEFIPKPIMKTIRGKRLVIFPGTGVFEIDHMKEGQKKKKSEKTEKVLNDIKKNTKKAAKASGGKGGGGGSASGAFAKSLSGAGARAVKDAIAPIVDAVNPMTYINLLGDLPVISELKDAAKAANEASKANKESRDEEKKEKPTTEPRKEQKEESGKTREQDLTEQNFKELRADLTMPANEALELAREDARLQAYADTRTDYALIPAVESIENIVARLLALATSSDWGRKTPRGDSFAKREKEVEGLRKKKKGVKAGDVKKEDGGGMFGWLGGLLSGGLMGMMGAILGAVGALIMPILSGLMVAAPFIALAAGVAGLIMLAINWDEVVGTLRNVLGIDAAQKDIRGRAEDLQKRGTKDIKTKKGQQVVQHKETGEYSLLEAGEKMDTKTHKKVKAKHRSGQSVEFSGKGGSKIMKGEFETAEEFATLAKESAVAPEQQIFRGLMASIVELDKAFTNEYEKMLLN